VLYIKLYNLFMTNLISISDARADLPDIVAKISKNMDRIIITVNGQPKATLISAEELESIEETAEVLAIPGVKQSAIRGLRQAKKGQGVSLAKL
jgi:antitoxin YefM